MIPAQFDYVAPESLDEALSALQGGGEDAKVLAGGHSLIPLMKLRLAAPTLLVDLRRVPGLTGIRRENGSWRLGAMTPHVAVVQGGLGLASAAVVLRMSSSVPNAPVLLTLLALMSKLLPATALSQATTTLPELSIATLGFRSTSPLKASAWCPLGSVPPKALNRLTRMSSWVPPVALNW